MKFDERGLTLVEVLVTLVILSFIGVTIWSVFFQGYNFSQKAISKNSLIQEANIVISQLTKIHQTAKEYELVNSSDQCKITAKVTKQDDSEYTEEYSSNPNVCIYYNLTNGIGNPIDPHLNDALLEITAYDKNDSTNKVTIETKLYRYKGDANYGG
ncbi:type II secretion system protein J [Neobacillus niacini]|uniref:type II secretion system protein J n=1 Tax=Neobacillus niacini TaxID=86668 RepID=UPI0039830C9F